jgi:glutamyl-tRNA reductase
VNLLVVGVSHRTAGVPLLERLAIPADQLPRVLGRLCAQEYLGEAMVLSTCNRVEVYAAVSAFHGGLVDIGAILAERVGCPVTELAPHLYVRYDVEAVRHAFRVAAGLDSMVVGESQILGQFRDAYSVAAEHGSVGRLLHELLQQALRVGKRAHAETGIDRAGQSIVTAALQLGLSRLAEAEGRASVPAATPFGEHRELDGKAALVIGAGSMGALALSTMRRAGAGPLYVANRGAERATRLAAKYDATVVPFADLATAVSTVDVIVSATGSPGAVLDAGTLAARRPQPLLVLDLAVPRDVAPGVGELPGVVLVDVERLGAVTGRPTDGDVHAAEEIVAIEVEAYLGWLRGSDVAPTVAALRSRAEEVVGAELRRLAQRNPDLTDAQRAEVAQSLHRVVQRLLHLPTVRVRQLAAEPGGEAYAAALRELFALDVDDPIDPVAAGEVKP